MMRHKGGPSGPLIVDPDDVRKILEKTEEGLALMETFKEGGLTLMEVLMANQELALEKTVENEKGLATLTRLVEYELSVRTRALLIGGMFIQFIIALLVAMGILLSEFPRTHVETPVETAQEEVLR